MQKVLHETCAEYVTRRLFEGWKIVGSYRHLVFLSPPDGSFIRPVDLRNDVMTLRPSADGDETSIASRYPASGGHWDKVDDVISDSDGTYVYNNSATFERDLYQLPASGGEGTINFIRVYNRSREVPVSGWSLTTSSIKSGGVVSDGGSGQAYSTYTLRYHDWATNPADDEAWEWADIDALQIGVQLKHSASGQTRCTQVYVEIDYTIITAPTVSTQAFSDIQKITAAGNGNITNTGGENCDKRGIVYGTTSHGDPGNVAPGASGYDAFEEETNSFGTGAFTLSLTGLIPGQTYYGRAYGHNSAGYSYGGEEVFVAMMVRHGFVNFQDPGIV